MRGDQNWWELMIDVTNPTMPEVSPSTAVGTRGSLGTVGGNTVRKWSKFQRNSNTDEDLTVNREHQENSNAHKTERRRLLINHMQVLNMSGSIYLEREIIQNYFFTTNDQQFSFTQQT